MANRIGVLLVDDHPLVRRGFRRMLEDDPDLQVVGEASTGEEAIFMATDLLPDVVVMDCAMPGTNGLEATRAILRDRPSIAILMLSMHSEDTLVRQALEAGAHGYVLKSALDLDLANAVKRVAAGERIMGAARPGPSALKGERARGLSARELEVLRLICRGKSNREIAVDLNLSANTVAVHRANIMAALDIHKRPSSSSTRSGTGW